MKMDVVLTSHEVPVLYNTDYHERSNGIAEEDLLRNLYLNVTS